MAAASTLGAAALPVLYKAGTAAAPYVLPVAGGIALGVYGQRKRDEYEVEAARKHALRQKRMSGQGFIPQELQEDMYIPAALGALGAAGGIYAGMQANKVRRDYQKDAYEREMEKQRYMAGEGYKYYRSKKRPSAWNEHVRKVYHAMREKDGRVRFADALKHARASYGSGPSKRGGAFDKDRFVHNTLVSGLMPSRALLREAQDPTTLQELGVDRVMMR